MSVAFSESEFVTELNRFRELFGQKSFWARPVEERQAAIDGLSHIYFNLDPKVTGVATLFEAALYEYHLRLGLMISHGLEVGR